MITNKSSMFETLSMPTGYVGLFTIYRMFTANFGAGCTEVYMFMEEVEAAVNGK